MRLHPRWRPSCLLFAAFLVTSISAQWLERTIFLPDSLGYLRNPTSMVENPLTGRMYVPSGSGVMLLDGTTGERVGVFRPSGTPVYCAGADRICVVATDTVLVIDARADTLVTGVQSSRFRGAVYSRESRRLYLYRTGTYPSNALVVDVPTATLVDSFEIPGSFSGAVWDSVTNRVFFAASEESTGVLVYDCATDSFIGHVWYDWLLIGSVALDPGLRKLYYLSRQNGDTICVIDPDSIAELARIPVPDIWEFELLEPKTHRLFSEHDTTTVVFDCRGDSVRTVLDSIEPLSLDWDRSSGEVYIAPDGRAGVAVLDTNDCIDRWLLTERGVEVVSVALNGDASTLFAGLAEDTLFLVDPQGGAIQNTVVAPYLRVAGLLHNPAGNVLYAFCYNKDVIAAIDRDGHVSGYAEGIPFGSDLSMVLNPVLNRLYVAGDNVLGVVDCNNMQVIHTESLPHFEETVMLLLADLGKLYLFPQNFTDTVGCCFRVFDCWSNSIVKVREISDRVPHAVYHPGAGLVYFCCLDTPSIRVLDPATDSVVRTLNAKRARPDDRLEVDLERGRVYYSAGRLDWLFIIEALTGTVLDSVELPRDADTLVMNQAQGKLYMPRYRSTDRLYVYDCVGDSLLPERNFHPNHVALLNVRNDKLYFESSLGLRAVDCRNDSMVAYWPEGQGTRSLAWNAIDNCVYAAGRGPEILVFADYPTGFMELPPKSVDAHRPCPTLVRGMLRIAGAGTRSEFGTNSVMSLVDIAGRKVMDLKPGENDVRSVAPGVYFITPHPNPLPQGERKWRSAVTKVIINP